MLPLVSTVSRMGLSVVKSSWRLSRSVTDSTWGLARLAPAMQSRQNRIIVSRSALK